MLEPKALVGKPLRLTNHIDVPARLDAGEWLIVFFSHSCSHCTQAMPSLRAVAQRLISQKSGIRLALIEMPPFAVDADSPAGFPPNCVLGHLQPRYGWLAQTPLEMRVSNGVVKFAKDNGNGLDWFDPITGRP